MAFDDSTVRRCEFKGVKIAGGTGGIICTLDRAINSITKFSDFSVDLELSIATLAWKFQLNSGGLA
jgi:hypothetical protein